jgi:HPt (histidine-containing phosphotransfer) domain-containing protein
MLSRQQAAVITGVEPVVVAPITEEVIAKEQPFTAVWEAPAKVEKPANPQRQLPDTVTDSAFLQQFTAGNTEKMRRYIGIFLDNAPKILESLTASLEKQDYAAIKISAHSLKPQLSYMGVKEEVSHVQHLEHMAAGNPEFGSVQIEINDLKRVCEKAFEELKPLLQ